ncbi:hexose-6-phosphate:phosphate antiporter [Bifidobacterium sp. ESL0784]|uniref:hexose-6-phosphate:phosphate antiporter n=1 Tax=Bifidobacterium sp. ESL0784 TaxID=2983231 RepID=UPI0023F6AC46|nr:hexose-6-phosphate:phosphate antiporter [Bifidobacterium sp. ESL0784]MDF7640541.1 hexose-6-phosphate:phosphate antiporter [Bifidobacterium sp. ESL0784]
MASNTFNLAFDKHVPKADLPVSQQRQKWFWEFMKPFLVTVMLYSIMYFVRDDFKAAQPLLKTQLHLTTSQLGLIGFAFSIAYGIGKVVVGYFMVGKDNKKCASIMLVAASIVVACFGFFLTMEHVPMGWLLALWAINGVVQCSAGPCCSAVIANWTTKKNYGRYYGIWNASHNIGGGLVGIFALWCANTFFHGKVAGMFIMPAIVAFIVGIICFFVGKNRPQDIGWESAETIFDEPAKEEDTTGANESTWTIFRKYLLTNPLVWILCVSDVFAYVMRIGIDNWSSLRVTEQLGFSNEVGAQAILYFAMGSMVGCIIWGSLSDIMKGRPGLVSLICIGLTPIPLFIYQNGRTPMVVLISLFFLGMFVFGPQVLIGISIVNQVPKKATALAGGMMGCFGYLFGDSTAKVLLSRIADSAASGLNIFGHVLHGWGATFSVLYVAVICAFILQVIVAITEEKKIRRANKAKVTAQ